MRILSKLSSEVLLLTFTIDSSVEIQDSYFDERFQLRRALRASIRASCFHACFGPRRQLRASIQFRGNFGLQASKSSTASVFAIGLSRVLGLPCTLRRVPSALAEWRRHCWRAPALAAGGRQNRARTGNLPQPHCSGSALLSNESYFTFVCILQLQ